jgi:hypothetical protein
MVPRHRKHDNQVRDPLDLVTGSRNFPHLQPPPNAARCLAMTVAIDGPAQVSNSYLSANISHPHQKIAIATHSSGYRIAHAARAINRICKSLGSLSMAHPLNPHSLSTRRIPQGAARKNPHPTFFKVIGHAVRVVFVGVGLVREHAA